MPRPRSPAFVVAVDRDVDERRALVVDPFDAVRAHDRPLDADARVPVDVALHVVGDARRERAARRDLLFVHRDASHRRRL